MNKFLKVFAAGLSIAFATISIPSYSQAPAQSACQSGGMVFGYFNGILATERRADASLEYLASLYGATSPQGDKIRYETFYNLSQGLFTDLVEVFNQRMAEQDEALAQRFELFWESLSGADEWWNLITGTSPTLRALQESLSSAVNTAIVRATTSMLAQNTPSTTVTQTEQRARIDTLAVEGKKLLFFAHSQGNLFANTAYRYVSGILPAGAFKLVHVAPASSNLNGDYVLADRDLIINALRSSGLVPPNNVSIPPAGQRTPGAKNETDVFGHGLLAIYLHPGLDTSAMVNTAVNKAMATMVAPPVRAQSGFFTVTLTWDGPGDIDLHTFEPSGAHVFYNRPRGASGFLDVDNQIGFGPEHYYATCDASQLQPGAYRVALANFARGDGRTATVQVATSADGVLATRQVLMGTATGNTTSADVFNVNVTRDPATGKLRASAS